MSAGRRALGRSRPFLLASALVAASALGAWASAPGASQGTNALAAEPASASHPFAEASVLRDALVSLLVAGALGAALAFRPQRRGTPPRSPAVIHTQIILALVGALVMIVVGASLARAFGIVGAASLVRYRAKIDDPKDAGVMLACLALGLASGVGIYWVAAFSTLIILAALWALESLEPEGRKDFLLKVQVKEAERLQPGLEALLKRHKVKYELRTSAQNDLTYSVEMALTKKTDRLTNAILALDNRDQMSVEWTEHKGKDKG